jgi:AmiR/NasT family two-component response regulator
MESVLLVSSTSKGADSLTMLLKSNGYAQILPVASGAEARRMAAQGNYGLVVINAPLSDEFGRELATSLTETTSASVILIVKNEVADDISAKVENYGVLVVGKPLSRPFFYQTLKLAAASRRRMLGLQKENQKLQNKIEEIRLIDRAKCLIIENLGMSEPQAHRYIEKKAMDSRVTRREIAQEILDQYEV